MAGLDDLQAIAEPWLAFMTRCLIEGGIAFAIVLAVWLPLRKRAPAQLGYALFLLVLVKLALPISIPAPAWTSWLAPETLLSAALPPTETESVPVTSPAAAPLSTVEVSVRSLPISSAHATSAAEPTAPLPWESWLFVAWASIASCLLLRFGVVQLRTWRMVRAARPAEPGDLGVDCNELVRLARVRRRVRWLITDAVDSPAAGGLRSSYVLVPAGLVPHLRARPLTWVLLHELAHIRRGDVWVALAQRLLGIAFFFHPVVWLANWLIDEQREFACDEDALRASRADPRECGAGFLTVVEWARDRETGAAATLAMFAPKSVIRRRLMRILNHDRRHRAGRLWTTSCVLATALFVLPSARAEAAPAPNPTPELRAQDPDRSDLAELRAELTKLRRQNAALQEKLLKLEQKMGGGRATSRSGGGAGLITGLRDRTRADAPASGTGVRVERVTEIPAKGRAIHLVERDGEVIEVKPDASGIYVIDKDSGRTISRVVTGTGKNRSGGGGRAGRVVTTAKPLRYYVSDGVTSVEAEVEIEAEAEGEPTGVLRGIVVNPRGEPAEGARITVRSPRRVSGVVSDSEGRFEVKDLAPGRAEVIVLTEEGTESLHEVITEGGEVKVIVRGEGESGNADAKTTKNKKARAKSDKIRIY